MEPGSSFFLPFDKIKDSSRRPLNFSAGIIARDRWVGGEWVAFLRSLGCELGPVTGWSFPSNDPVRAAHRAVFEARMHEQMTRCARWAEGEDASSINRIRLPRGETPLTPPESLSLVIAALNFISAPIRQRNGTHIRGTRERAAFIIGETSG